VNEGVNDPRLHVGLSKKTLNCKNENAPSIQMPLDKAMVPGIVITVLTSQFRSRLIGVLQPLVGEQQSSTRERLPSEVSIQRKQR
jgi:hypothetical protein